jgi:hypothetical protein
MTFEEINQTLQTVAQSQARFDKTVKQIAEAHKTLIELVRIQDGRIDGHDGQHRESDERIEALINSQIRADEHIEALINSQARADERIEALINSQARADERIEALINSQVRANERIEALINSQVRANEHIEALINAQVRYEAKQDELEEAFRLVAVSHAQLVEMIQLHENRLDGHDEAQARADGRIDALINDQIAVRRQAEERGRILDEKLARLQEAQSRADEQIRLLTGHNGDTTR